MEGKPAAGRWAARRAIAAEPDLTPAYFTLVEAALARRDHAETARLLILLEKDHEGLEEFAVYRNLARRAKVGLNGRAVAVASVVPAVPKSGPALYNRAAAPTIPPPPRSTD